MANTKQVLIACVTLILFIGCSSPYTYNDNGKTIELSEDDPFQIVLESDNHPNFSWSLVSRLEFTKLLSTDTIHDKDIVTVYVFNFKTISDGKDSIELVYTDGIEIKKTFKITVIVGTIGLITSK